ncbi:MAG: hypothetical protein K6V73_12790 [Firmicutes bacterium]|nr:hypothetical protein [Bacillota bacterium]
MNHRSGEQQLRAWARLWKEVRPAPPHAVEATALGEYAAVRILEGPTAAARRFPEIARHLDEGCERCEADLKELVVFLDGERQPQPDPHERWLPTVLALAWHYGGVNTAAFRIAEYPELVLQGVESGGDTQLNLGIRLRTDEVRLRVDGWELRVADADGQERFRGVTDAHGALRLPGISVPDLIHARLEVKPPVGTEGD